MPIQKFWHNDARKEDNYIVLEEDRLLRLKNLDSPKIKQELNKGIINEAFVGLPLNYIRTVDYKEEDNRLRIIYNKDSEEEIHISNPTLRKDVFDGLRATKKFKYSHTTPDFFTRAKKPLSAVLVVLCSFALVTWMIQEPETWMKMEEGRIRGIFKVPYALSKLGQHYNNLIFGTALAIAFLGVIRKRKNTGEVFQLSRK